MPGHAGSPYWAAVDFDSEGEEEQATNGNRRVYLDPWDSEAYGIIQAETTESSQGDNLNSFAGEPVSASFYYVPTKNYESEEEASLPRKNVTPPQELVPEYIYGRKRSRPVVPDYHQHKMAIYEERAMRHRRRSLYIDEPVYAPHPMFYEPMYGMIPPPPGYHPPPPRSRMSLPHHPEYMMANLPPAKSRRHSRLTDSYDQCAYESLSPEYEDWARPFPKSAPENFHLSRYGHLQIDYSCSWNSLDRLIRSQSVK